MLPLQKIILEDPSQPKAVFFQLSFPTSTFSVPLLYFVFFIAFSSTYSGLFELVYFTTLFTI
jgi:hypothetical protein